MTGLSLSANPLQPSNSVRKLRFGSAEQPKEQFPDDKKPLQKSEAVQGDEDAFTASSAGGKSDSVKRTPYEDRRQVLSGEVKHTTDAKAAKAAAGAHQAHAPQWEEQVPPGPEKNKKYWAKSILLSAVSLAALGAMVLAMIPGIGIGMIPALGMILGGLLVHDLSTNISRQKGLANISDLDFLRNVLLERSRRPVEIASRFAHPLSSEKRALFVEKHLHRVQNIDPHKLLNKTGLDYQTMLNDLKAESAVAAKAFIVGRFMALFIIKRGLGGFMAGRGKILGWLAMGLWALISQNKHGSLQGQPVAPPGSQPRLPAAA